MNRIIAFLLFLHIGFFAGTTTHAQSKNKSKLILPSGNFEDLRRTGKAKVIEAVSPLTVKLDDGRFIHLAGLDFPDLDYYDPGDLSVTAVKILNDFLKGKAVIIYQTRSPNQGRVNRLGHEIAHLVRLDKDVWVQGMILSLGLARVRTTKYNPEMAEQMLQLEQRARKKEDGLWGISEYPILNPKTAENYIGSYQIVEGAITKVARQKNTLYLNFGQNWRKDFTVSIKSSDLRGFLKSGTDPQSWGGKTIRVRGWIESWNGPHIKIDHPQRLETLGITEQTISKKAPALGLPSTQKRPAKTSLPDPDSALPRFND